MHTGRVRPVHTPLVVAGRGIETKRIVFRWPADACTRGPPAQDTKALGAETAREMQVKEHLHEQNSSRFPFFRECILLLAFGRAAPLPVSIPGMNILFPGVEMSFGCHAS